MPVPPLTLRLVKGSPLTAAQGDADFAALRDFANALETRINIALNADGTTKSPVVVTGSSTTGSDDYVTTLDQFTPATEADLIGKLILLKPTDILNDSVPTLRILPLVTPRAIKLPGGVGLNAGDMRPNHQSALVWDNVNSVYELLNPCTVGRNNYYDDSGLKNAYVVAGTPLTAPFAQPVALYTGYRLSVKIAHTNDAASTLKVGSLAVTAVVLPDGSALIGGELPSGRIVEFIYNGTSFVVGAGSSSTSGPKFITPVSIATGSAAVVAYTLISLAAYVPDGTTAVILQVTGQSGAGSTASEIHTKRTSGATDIYTVAGHSMTGGSDGGNFASQATIPIDGGTRSFYYEKTGNSMDAGTWTMSLVGYY